MAKKEKKKMCCKGGFPTFAVVVLVVGLIWLLNDLKVLAMEIPWFPIVLIIIAIGWIIDSMKKK